MTAKSQLRARQRSFLDKARKPSLLCSDVNEDKKIKVFETESSSLLKESQIHTMHVYGTLILVTA